MPISKGDAFLIWTPSARDNNRRHLFFCLCNPNPECILVSISGLTPKSEQTCILQIGEHPFIIKESGVFYRSPRQETEESINRMIAEGNCIPKDPASNELIEKICQGAHESGFAPMWLSRKLKENSAI